MLLGDEPVGHRTLWWNLVASDPKAIELATRDWQASIDAGFSGSRFALPPDEDEHIPLPDSVTGPPAPSKDCPTT